MDKDKLATNLSSLPKMASAWVISAAGALGAIWLALPPEQQRALVEHSPLPAWAYPVALTVAGLAARVWPQKSLTPDDPETPKDPT